MGTDAAAGTVVLVHGGFVDGSGWRDVYDQLKKDGYNVAVVQNPTFRSKATPPRPSASSTRRANRSFSSVIPMAAR